MFDCICWNVNYIDLDHNAGENISITRKACRIQIILTKNNIFKDFGHLNNWKTVSSHKFHPAGPLML